MHFLHSGPLHFSTHVMQCSTVRVRAYYAGCCCLQLVMLPAAFLGILSNLNSALHIILLCAACPSSRVMPHIQLGNVCMSSLSASYMLDAHFTTATILETRML